MSMYENQGMYRSAPEKTPALTIWQSVLFSPSVETFARSRSSDLMRASFGSPSAIGHRVASCRDGYRRWENSNMEQLRQILPGSWQATSRWPHRHSPNIGCRALHVLPARSARHGLFIGVGCPPGGQTTARAGNLHRDLLPVSRSRRTYCHVLASSNSLADCSPSSGHRAPSSRFCRLVSFVKASTASYSRRWTLAPLTVLPAKALRSVVPGAVICSPAAIYGYHCRQGCCRATPRNFSRDERALDLGRQAAPPRNS
jgi:hypothetical protein